MPTIDQVVSGFIQLRDAKKAIVEKHKEELKPYNEKLYKMELWMQNALNNMGALNTKTKDGHTVYLASKITPKVVDRDAFFEFVRENELWDMLTSGVSKEAIEGFLESTGELPPGVTITKETNARVRK